MSIKAIKEENFSQDVPVMKKHSKLLNITVCSWVTENLKSMKIQYEIIQ